jgi:hypothetical protein
MNIDNKSRTEKSQNKRPKLNEFASGVKRFKLVLPRAGGSSMSLSITERTDSKTDRIQLHGVFVPDALLALQYNGPVVSDSGRKEFCIMGVSMIDLYDGPSNLFCASMAFGGDKVAAFSFARYHPCLKMHPQQWHHYGYTTNKLSDGYSYYERSKSQRTVSNATSDHNSDGRQG